MSRFSGSDVDFLSDRNFDPNFTAEINNKMRVPKKICVVGGGGDGEKVERDEMGDLNDKWTGRPEDKNHMQVPDRIRVTGHDKHVGSKSLPRELQLETVVMPPDPELIRIQTPPRSITIQNEHKSLIVENEGTDDHWGSDEDVKTWLNDSSRMEAPFPNENNSMISFLGAHDNSVAVHRRGKRETRPYSSEGKEELEHLREQLSRMNRRLLAVEADSCDRKERERYLLMASLIYVAYKTVSWLFKSGGPHHI